MIDWLDCSGLDGWWRGGANFNAKARRSKGERGNRHMWGAGEVLRRFQKGRAKDERRTSEGCLKHELVNANLYMGEKA